MRTNQQILLTCRPTDRLDRSHFALVEHPAPEPGRDEVLVRTILLSIDPANRAWMQARTYRDPLHVGDVVAGFGIGEVIGHHSPAPLGTAPSATASRFPVGTLVECESGWQNYAVLSTTDLRRVEPSSSLQHHMGVLGITGLTAYFGLLKVGRPQAVQTVVVSAAAGATGHIVGQLARIHGCRVVGITGSDDKNAVLTDELEFDAAINHRAASFKTDLRAACPDGVDLYFDNVGGPVLEQVLRRMNIGGCVVCCGVVSQYDTGSPAAGPRGVPGLLVTKRLRMEGFLLPDYAAEWDTARRDLARWLASGQITPLETVIEGLDRAPDTLLDLLAGRTIGKTIVRVAPDPKRDTL